MFVSYNKLIGEIVKNVYHLYLKKDKYFEKEYRKEDA